MYVLERDAERARNFKLNSRYYEQVTYNGNMSAQDQEISTTLIAFGFMFDREELVYVNPDGIVAPDKMLSMETPTMIYTILLEACEGILPNSKAVVLRLAAMGREAVGL